MTRPEENQKLKTTVKRFILKLTSIAGAAFYGTFNGYIVGMNLYRAYAAFALVGAAIGLYTPV